MIAAHLVLIAGMLFVGWGVARGFLKTHGHVLEHGSEDAKEALMNPFASGHVLGILLVGILWATKELVVCLI